MDKRKIKRQNRQAMTAGYYFDNAATTLISEAALKTYTETARDYFGNPSAAHREGAKAHACLEECRKDIAGYLGIRPSSLFFTSGATEAISIVFSSLLHAKRPGRVITSAIEHEAVLGWKGILTELGWKFDTLRAKGGFVKAEDLEAALDEDVRLVAVQLVNNVTGAIQDIPSLVNVVRKAEERYGRRIFFFCDSVQALGKIQFSLSGLDVDGASFSAHKIRGPRGIGALYLKKGDIQVLSKAGGQERGVRGGTENLPAIAAFRTALLEDHHRESAERLCSRLRSELEGAGIRMLSPAEQHSPYILSFTTPLPSEVLTRMMADKGYCISSGSACSNNARGKAEGVILAMGFSSKDAGGAIRVSFCGEESEESVSALAEEIIRAVSGFRR